VSRPSGPALARAVALGAALVLLLTPGPAAAQPSPVDRLAEIRDAIGVVEAAPQFMPGAFFPLVTLNEPPKAELLAWTPGSAFRREALVQVYDRAGNRVSEVVVDLRQNRVVSWTVKAQSATGRLPQRVGRLVRSDSRGLALASRHSGSQPAAAVHLHRHVGAPGRP
jgi:primary-amine oxidase